jgi:hypothetical protein
MKKILISVLSCLATVALAETDYIAQEYFDGKRTAAHLKATEITVESTMTTPSVTASGTVTAEQLTSTDDATVTDDLTVGGSVLADEFMVTYSSSSTANTLTNMQAITWNDAMEGIISATAGAEITNGLPRPLTHVKSFWTIVNNSTNLININADYTVGGVPTLLGASGVISLDDRYDSIQVYGVTTNQWLLLNKNLAD